MPRREALTEAGPANTWPGTCRAHAGRGVLLLVKAPGLWAFPLATPANPSCRCSAAGAAPRAPPQGTPWHFEVWHSVS